MFGIGFTEILLISVIAILFLGPDKLPGTMVQIAKFIKSVKKTVGDAKSSLEEEMKIADLKEEALSYKEKLDSATSELRSFKNIDIDDIMEEATVKPKTPKPASRTEEKAEEVEVEVEKKNETVTLKKKSRKKKAEKVAGSEEAPAETKAKSDKKEGDA